MATSTAGIDLNTHRPWLATAIELISSMRFAISLLSLLAVASVIGTVMKQNEPIPNYINQFGPFWYEVFNKLGLYYQKIGNWEKAKENFKKALAKIGKAAGRKDDAYAKVLFNYSDVLKSEGNWLEYNQCHSEAKRIWSDSFHPD